MYTVKTNITISVDSEVIAKARRRAAREGRTVTEAVRGFLEDFSATDAGRSELDTYLDQMNLGVAGRKFTRDEMNDR